VNLKHDDSLHQLSHYLESLIIRVESGQALAQALKDAPKIYLEAEWIERWKPLRNKILSGAGSHLDALKSFYRSLVLHQKLERLIKKKSFLPLLQAISVIGISLVMLLFTQFFAAEIFQLKLGELLLILLWLGLGSAWTLHLLKLSRQELWVSDWITFINSIENRISWGQNFLCAWQESRALEKNLAPELKKFLNQSFPKARLYEHINLNEVKFSKKLAVRRAQERWLQIHKIFVQNERIRQLLENESQSAYSSLEDSLELSADKLSAQLLMPLFIFFMPSSIIVILMPILRVITTEF
jgi:hypothetical protein